MNYEAVWQTFTETGDPMGYLLYKAAESDRSRKKEKKTGEREKTDVFPRPLD